MRVSRDEMEKSHGRIIDSAARLMREHGIEGTSVADVMAEAGMTQGGFYRHFATKEALVIATIQQAFAAMAAPLAARFAKRPAGAVEEYRAYYLSAAHVENPGTGCPIASLAVDAARGSAAVRQAFGDGVGRAVEILSRAVTGTAAAAKQRAALRELAMMVGAVVMARASDKVTATNILEACRTAKLPAADDAADME